MVVRNFKVNWSHLVIFEFNSNKSKQLNADAADAADAADGLTRDGI